MVSPEDSRIVSEFFGVNFVSDAVHPKDLISQIQQNKHTQIMGQPVNMYD
ncbi:hypothetical protein AQPE_4031 [Aquipluma nitroreducens]|uniref:Uncharacterized protein n=1 Tax=Aquipluma nitroreducens TaxID=2010828 RepID=A0A5K7SE44_9BACT|nr:hypothetical protein AQPE_4031 [Aquipluma nitroreducens]